MPSVVVDLSHSGLSNVIGSTFLAPYFLHSMCIPTMNTVNTKTCDFYCFALLSSSNTSSLPPTVPVLPPTPKVSVIPARSASVFSSKVQLLTSSFTKVRSTYENQSIMRSRADNEDIRALVPRITYLHSPPFTRPKSSTVLRKRFQGPFFDASSGGINKSK
jgi:hypothetical protein